MGFWRGLIAAAVLATVLPAAAQIRLGSFTHMSMTGTVGAGYSGGYTDQSGSSTHQFTVNGDADLTGFYFNPGFLNFDIHPYYGRSQDSANSISIGTTSGAAANFGIFSGSRTPGSLGYNISRDGTGSYAIPGSSSLVTQSNGQGFSIGWSLVPSGLPNISASFSHGTADSKIIGIDGTNTSTNNGFSLSSSYNYAGWPMQFSYTRQTSDGESSQGLTGLGSTDNSKTWAIQYNTSHTIPFRSSMMTLSLGRTSTNYHSSDTDGDKSSGGSTSNNVVATYSMLPTRSTTLSSTFSYDGNALSSAVQQLLNNGAVVTGSSSPLRTLNYGASMGWNIPIGVVVTGGATRIQQFYKGNQYGSSQVYANASYNYSRPLFGSLYVIGGMSDSASKEGNTGAGLYGILTFSRHIEKFEVSASVGYSQNIQTLASFVTTSGVSYNATASRRFLGRTHWHGSFYGTRSGFSAGGSSTHSESFNVGFSRRKYAASVFGGQAHQYLFQGTSGLVSTGLPTSLVGSTISYDSQNLGFSGSATLFRRLILSGAHSKATGTTLNGTTSTNNTSTTNYVLLRYSFRQLYFTANYNRLMQGTVVSGTTIRPVTSYSFGIYRGIKFF